MGFSNFIPKAVLNPSKSSYTLISKPVKEVIVIDTFLLQKVFTLALLTEIITNFVKTLVPDLDKNYITTIAGLFGIVLTWLADVGIFMTLGIPLKFVLIDYILTGIIVSRGANLVHDLAKRLNV